MTFKDYACLARRLLPQLGDMLLHRSMLLKLPVAPVLRGIYFEGSNFSAEAFYVWVFWMPLYVPTDVITLNMGTRIRDESGGDRWNAADPRLVDKLTKALLCRALPFLQELETLEDVVRVATRAAEKSADPYIHEALAYTLAKTGNTEAAVHAIDALLGLLNPAISWQERMSARARILKHALLTNADKAAALLESWMADSLHKLGLAHIPTMPSFSEQNGAPAQSD